MKKHYLSVILLFFITNAIGQNIVISDYHFSNKLQENISIDSNSDGVIQVSEALAVTTLTLNDASIVDLTGIAYFSNVTNLNINNNNLTNIDLSALTNLQILDCSNNALTALNVSTAPNLRTLYVAHNPLTSLNFTGLNLTNLWCYNTNLPSLNVAGMTNLTDLKCYNNPNLASINANGAVQLSTFSLDTLPNLLSLSATGCAFEQLNLLTNDALQTIDLSNSLQLGTLRCSSSALSNLTLTGCTSLFELRLSNSQLTSLSLEGFSTLYNLFLNNNLQLTNLNLSRCRALNYADISQNSMNYLDVSGCLGLYNLNCSNNQLTTIDATTCTFLYVLDASNNQLQSLYIKNGRFENGLTLTGNPNLTFACVDEFQTVSVQNNLGPGVTISTDCVFDPLTAFNAISGNFTFDQNQNGCDASDSGFSNLKVNLSRDEQPQSSLYSNAGAEYKFYTQTGNYTVTPEFENPDYFTVNPTSVTTNFVTASGTDNQQNFCVVPNGIHPDLEVLLLPLSVPRPGFNVLYRVVYRNKGNTTQSGTVAFHFEDAILDLVTADPVASSQVNNILSWNFVDLKPFEQRAVTIMLNLNSGSEIPAVFFGNSISFAVDATSAAQDATPNDNHIDFNQTVVGAFDPNDVTCLEGNVIDMAGVGDYVHYMIRFENTGTANAENVLLKDLIDPTKFDISTLVPLTGSHSYATTIKENNVDFDFKNINLPFAFGYNQGYVVFKIKTKSDLVAGDTFTNKAAIYFDYNLPVITNVASTTIALLSNPNFEFSNHFKLYPNPSSTTITIETTDNRLHAVNIYNSLGQIVLALTNVQSKTDIDISSLKTGIYYVEVSSNKGKSNTKFIKK